MKKTLFLTCFRLFLLMVTLAILNSCSKTEPAPQAIDLKVESEVVTMLPNAKVIINIQSGNGNYTLSNSNPNALDAKLTDNQIEILSKNGTTDQEAILVLTDKTFQRKQIKVSISTNFDLTLDKRDLQLTAQQGIDSVTISNFSGTLALKNDAPQIASAQIINNKLYITGKKNGACNLVIENNKGVKKEVKITINGNPTAMEMGENYFGFANFQEIAVVDPSIRKLKKVTFELNCKINGYRGLQSFFGLEGKLVVRGKNDDYRETHPIEIAGLDDKIILESINSFNLNEWMSLALVVDCDKSTTLEKYKLYINGIAQSLKIIRENATHTSVDLASSNDDNLFCIGRNTTQSFRVIKGTVGEARVWQSARTEEQIKNNLYDLKETNPSGLIARWIFSPGTATNYIQDINGGKYETRLYLADAKSDRKPFLPLTVQKTSFTTKNYPQ